MATDFFSDAQKTTSRAVQFGLCDDAPPATNPAYIDEGNSAQWIGILNNRSATEVSFYPIDRCVDLRRANNEPSKRCDGLLKYGNRIHFVELKDRRDMDTYTTRSGEIRESWLDKGIEQLRETIAHFILHHNKDDYSFQDCYVCNKQVFRRSARTHMVQFKNDTKEILGGRGLILCVNKTIDIQTE